MVQGAVGRAWDLQNRSGAFLLLLLFFLFLLLTYSSSLAISLSVTNEDLKNRHV